MHHLSNELQVPSNAAVFIHSAAAVPQMLLRKFCELNALQRNIRIYALHTEGNAPWADENYRTVFIPQPFFVGANTRHAIQMNHGSYLPVTLSEAPTLFRKKILPLDLALVSVSPADKHGFHSLGPSVDVTRAAIESAKKVVAQINGYIPRTFGDTLIHKRDIDAFFEYSELLPVHQETDFTCEDQKIAENIAELIPNRATLQIGIGHIPSAVLEKLVNHRDLGIHTEVLTDAILPLLDKGVVTNRYKKYECHVSVCSFAIGTQALFEFLHDNPTVRFLECSKTNNPGFIASNPNTIAINSAIEIDLSGQVCADSIGTLIYSGAGGQPDFMRGAMASNGGKAIIGMRSLSNDGQSKIVSILKPGAGVVSTRTDIQWVVTEYGAVNLYGKTIFERAKLLTSIAHPQFRASLWNEFESMHDASHG
jgi:4-hydroxybutyrate CoA-transferase